MTNPKEFNPYDHLIAVTVTNAEGEAVMVPYLPERASEVWFRTENPRGRIATELIGLAPESATFKAKIYFDVNDANPAAEATAIRYVNESKFYITAAETAAVGKALSRMGYGTPLNASLGDGAEPSKELLEEGVPVDSLFTTVSTIPINAKSTSAPENISTPEINPAPAPTHKSSAPSKDMVKHRNRNIDEEQGDVAEPVVRKSEHAMCYTDALEVVMTFPSWKGKKMKEILEFKNQNPKDILEYILTKTNAQKFANEHLAAKIILEELEAKIA